MKKVLILIVALCACLAAAASNTTKYAVESLFDGRYNNHPHTGVTILKNNQSIFKKLTVENDSKIMQEMERLIRLDEGKASNSVERYEKGEFQLILSMPSGTSIGFSRETNSQGSLFISVPLLKNTTTRIDKSRKSTKSRSQSKSTSKSRSGSRSTTTTITTSGDNIYVNDMTDGSEIVWLE